MHTCVCASDFGMAARVPVRRTVGTLFYVAPEILTEGWAEQPADMWRCVPVCVRACMRVCARARLCAQMCLLRWFVLSCVASVHTFVFVCVAALALFCMCCCAASRPSCHLARHPLDQSSRKSSQASVVPVLCVFSSTLPNEVHDIELFCNWLPHRFVCVLFAVLGRCIS